MKPIIHSNTRVRQRGQALLWFLVTVAATCIVLAIVYNVGQVANEKEKTVNAADASALSGALVEARILNFTAYTNRAMIANEVTIAQLVSADSWVRYDATMAQYLAEYLQVLAVIPIVGSAIVTSLNTYAQVLQYVQQGTDYAAEILIPACNVTIDALKLARDGAIAVAPIAAHGVASGIANANLTTFGGRYDEQPELNPALEAGMWVKNTLDWNDFTKDYGGDDRGNAKDVILKSRDQFSIERGAGPLIDTINTLLEVGGLLATVGTSYYGFDKTSKTTTLKDFDHWQAQDSLDPFQATLDFCWGIPCGYVKLYGWVPLAYGRADADTDGSVGKDMCQPSFFSFFGTTANCKLAKENANVINSEGIPNIVDLAHPGGSNTPDPTLTFVAGVQKKADATLTTQRMGLNTVHVDGPQGSPDLQDNMQNGDRLTSIATAKIFYARPDWNPKDITQGNLPRPDHIHEYASLYNPYWQARLTPTDETVKAGFYGLIGSNPLLSPMTP